MVKRIVYPINLRKKDFIEWEKNENFFAEAYIFSSKEECIQYITELISNVCKNMYKVFILIQSYYDEIDSSPFIQNMEILERKNIKNSLLGCTDSHQLTKYLGEILQIWGETARIQLFFTKEGDEGFINKVHLLSKKYYNSHKEYFEIIYNCDYIISDTGDGEEFELIQKSRRKISP